MPSISPPYLDKKSVGAYFTNTRLQKFNQTKRRLLYVSAGRKYRISRKYLKMVPLYRYFARHWEECLDFSDEALWSLYQYESAGIGQVAQDNGFAQGKKWMDVAVAQWREDMWTTLFPWELFEDENLPDWWLEKVLGIKSYRLTNK